MLEDATGRNEVLLRSVKDLALHSLLGEKPQIPLKGNSKVGQPGWAGSQTPWGSQ